MRRLFRSVFRLFDWWWRSDRIRVSPREGRLLRLAPGCFIRVSGEPARVMSRRIARCADGPLVAYRCESATAAYELVVRLTSTEPVVGVRRDAWERLIAEDEVEVVRAAGLACLKRSSS